MSEGLLLLHAFPVDHRMWEAQLLGPRTIAPDHPGFGEAAQTPDGVMTMGLAAESALAAADAAGLDRFVVCGLSMGGYVAFELWRRAPERIAGLVLANTRAMPDTPEGADGRRALAARLRSEGNVLADAPPPLLGERAGDDLRERVRGWIGEQSADAIAAASLGMADRPDSTGDLAGIDVPTLIITSDLDAMIPPEQSAPMAEAIPGARLEVLDGAGHLSNLEAPERFAALVAEHCARCGVEP